MRGTKLSTVSVATCVAVAMMTSLASAQGYSYPTPPPQNQQTTPSPQSVEPAPESTPEPEPTEKVGASRGFQGGGNIGVPLFLDVDTDIVRRGADLHFFGGYDIGYVMFGANLGAMWVPVDGNNIPNLPAGINPGRNPATRIYLSPEVRVQVPNKALFLPYVAMTFDMNWWHFKETGVACNFWYCTEVNVFRFTPGFTAKAGIAFRMKRGAHLDVGMKYSYSGAGDFFRRKQQWVTPYVGFLIR